MSFSVLGNLALYAETEEGARALVTILFSAFWHTVGISSYALVVERVERMGDRDRASEDYRKAGWRISSPPDLTVLGSQDRTRVGFSVFVEERK